MPAIRGRTPGPGVVTAGQTVARPPRKTRIASIVAALLLVAALCLHAVIWYRTGVIDWTSAANMGGLLVLRESTIRCAVGYAWRSQCSRSR